MTRGLEHFQDGSVALLCRVLSGHHTRVVLGTPPTTHCIQPREGGPPSTVSPPGQSAEKEN